MGTRGVMGFRHKSKDKLIYNHFDSYPEHLGNEISLSLSKVLNDSRRGIEWLKKKVDALKMVNDDVKPTEADKKKLAKYTDLQVSEQSTDDWYCLTRRLQGKMIETLIAGYAIESEGFIYDSLFCEWAYVVNLDTKKLEVYKGFQRYPHDKGRYADHPVENDNPHRSDTYFPCALIKEIPFSYFKKLKKPKKDENVSWVTKLREELVATENE